MRDIEVILNKLRKDKIEKILSNVSGAEVASLFAYVDSLPENTFISTYADFETRSNKDRYDILKALVNRHKEYNGEINYQKERLFDKVYATIFQVEGINY